MNKTIDFGDRGKLPIDIGNLIFSFLSFNDLQSCSQVCSEWKIKIAVTRLLREVKAFFEKFALTNPHIQLGYCVSQKPAQDIKVTLLFDEMLSGIKCIQYKKQGPVFPGFLFGTGARIESNYPYIYLHGFQNARKASCRVEIRGDISKGNHTALQQICQYLFEKKIGKPLPDRVGLLPTGAFENVFSYLSFLEIVHCKEVGKRWKERLDGESVDKILFQKFTDQHSFPNTIRNIQELKFEYSLIQILRDFYRGITAEKRYAKTILQLAPEETIEISCFWDRDSNRVPDSAVQTITFSLKTPYQGQVNNKINSVMELVHGQPKAKTSTTIHFHVKANNTEWKRFYSICLAVMHESFSKTPITSTPANQGPLQVRRRNIVIYIVQQIASLLQTTNFRCLG